MSAVHSGTRVGSSLTSEAYAQALEIARLAVTVPQYCLIHNGCDFLVHHLNGELHMVTPTRSVHLPAHMDDAGPHALEAALTLRGAAYEVRCASEDHLDTLRRNAAQAEERAVRARAREDERRAMKAQRKAVRKRFRA